MNWTSRKPRGDHRTSGFAVGLSLGGYWYNIASGAVRARVHFDDSEEDTVDLYDEINLTGLGGDDE